MGHRQGENRHQTALFPLMLDELVGPDDLVRVIDAWISSLDLKALGFSKAQTQIMGRPPYNPADLLKLYIWGYLNAVRSSRALERQTHSNVKCMWLLGRLQPDHKTIAQEIERYLQLLDAQDTHQDTQPQTKAHDVQRALRQLRERQTAIQTDVEQLANNRSSALVQTEPQARHMKSLHGPGYNLQTAVEATSHLIVMH